MASVAWAFMTGTTNPPAGAGFNALMISLSLAD